MLAYFIVCSVVTYQQILDYLSRKVMFVEYHFYHDLQFGLYFFGSFFTNEFELIASGCYLYCRVSLLRRFSLLLFSP